MQYDLSIMDSPSLPKHPAKYSLPLYEHFYRMLTSRGRPPVRLIDPFAGVGGIFLLQSFLPDTEIKAIEIEPEWAAHDSRVTVGNALDLPYPDNYFDAACTSPSYGNRMADHHEATDNSIRHTYRHYLGRPLSIDNSGQLQWGDRYRDFHERAWTELRRVLIDQSLFVFNCKDHYRGGKIQRVVDWHANTLIDMGFDPIDMAVVPLSGNQHGQNGSLRVDEEVVLLFVLSK